MLCDEFMSLGIEFPVDTYMKKKCFEAHLREKMENLRKKREIDYHFSALGEISRLNARMAKMEKERKKRDREWRERENHSSALAELYRINARDQENRLSLIPHPEPKDLLYR